MTKLTLRVLGASMAAIAAVTLFLVFSTAQAPVEAASCCQTCEVNENACDNACNLNFEPGDDRDACFAECYHQLYERPSSCWLHCFYCGANSPVVTTCMTCSMVGVYDMTGTLQYIDYSCGPTDPFSPEVPFACFTW